MKQWRLLLFLVFASAATAQNFEGTITWAIKYELADPVRKAEMEKRQKEMSNPASQEKMKKMQEQMNTPEMKAMLDKNPQMKAQMENAMKIMQGGDMGAVVPKNFIVKSKGNNSLTKMEGGVMAMEILYLVDKGLSYKLDRNAKTFALLPSGNAADRKTDSIRHKVTKTAETMQIMNYNCIKYIVELTMPGGTANQILWTSTDIKGLDMRRFSNQQAGNSNQSFYYEGIAGVPLRMEMVTKQTNMVMEVIEIKKEVLPAADFTIPADFKEKKYAW